MVNTIHGTEQVKRIVKTMLITCGLICAYGLYGYYTGIAINAGRLVATFEYHSKIARYISLLLPITVCLFFWYKNILIRLSLILLVFLCSFSLILKKHDKHIPTNININNCLLTAKPIKNIETKIASTLFLFIKKIKEKLHKNTKRIRDSRINIFLYQKNKHTVMGNNNDIYLAILE